MNNTCPSCGAVYNVATKDVGRRIKCKKCGAALAVTDAGLELDGVPAEHDHDHHDDDRAVRPSRRRFDSAGAVAAVGGFPTVLFGAGALLVIFSTFQSVIGDANIARREAIAAEAGARVARNIAAVNDNKDLDEAKKQERIKKINEDWDKEKKKLDEAREDVKFSKATSLYWEQWLMMLGYLLVFAGALGFLQANQPLILRIVAAIILVGMVLGIFRAALGIKGSLISLGG